MADGADTVAGGADIVFESVRRTRFFWLAVG
jgi:hypothetical protein